MTTPRSRRSATHQLLAVMLQVIWRRFTAPGLVGAGRDGRADISAGFGKVYIIYHILYIIYIYIYYIDIDRCKEDEKEGLIPCFSTFVCGSWHIFSTFDLMKAILPFTGHEEAGPGSTSACLVRNFCDPWCHPHSGSFKPGTH